MTASSFPTMQGTRRTVVTAADRYRGLAEGATTRSLPAVLPARHPVITNARREMAA